MKMRLTFVVLLGLAVWCVPAIDLDEYLFDLVTYAPVVDPVRVDPLLSEAYVPMPEPQQWFSFLDQTTGTWSRAAVEQFGLDKPVAVVEATE